MPRLPSLVRLHSVGIVQPLRLLTTAILRAGAYCGPEKGRDVAAMFDPCPGLLRNPAGQFRNTLVIGHRPCQVRAILGALTIRPMPWQIQPMRSAARAKPARSVLGQ